MEHLDKTMTKKPETYELFQVDQHVQKRKPYCTGGPKAEFLRDKSYVFWF